MGGDANRRAAAEDELVRHGVQRRRRRIADDRCAGQRPRVARIRHPRARPERDDATHRFETDGVEDQAPPAVARLHRKVDIAADIVLSVAIRKDVGRRIVAGRQFDTAADLHVPRPAGGWIGEGDAG